MTGAPPDSRPLVKDLLAKHSKAVEIVRTAIQNDDVCKTISAKNSEDNAKRYDDIWILRFVLSHKGHVASASKAAIKTIKFRDEKKLNELGDIRHRLRGLGVQTHENYTSEPLPENDAYDRCCAENSAFFTQPDKDRGLLLYCDVGKMDMDAISETLTEEQMTEYMIYLNEAVFQILDDVTRRTGRLTKQMKMVDMGNVHLTKMNRTYIKRDAAVSKSLEDYYPQLLGCMYIANSPSWLSMVWLALRPFFPKRMVEKLDFLPSLAKLKKSSNYKTYLKSIERFVSLEDLPERYGGLNKEWPLPCASKNFQDAASK